MNIRAATLEDVPLLVRMGEAFLEGSSYGRLFPASPGRLEALVRTVVTVGIGLVAVEPPATLMGAETLLGMIGALLYEHPFSGEMVADEVAWWVNPDARARRAGPLLLVSLKAEATNRGAVMLKVSSPAGTRVAEYLEGNGYVPVETAFLTRLGP